MEPKAKRPAPAQDAPQATEELHPSWAAKLVAKQKLAADVRDFFWGEGREGLGSLRTGLVWRVSRCVPQRRRPRRRRNVPTSSSEGAGATAAAMDPRECTDNTESRIWF